MIIHKKKVLIIKHFFQFNDIIYASTFS